MRTSPNRLLGTVFGAVYVLAGLPNVAAAKAVNGAVGAERSAPVRAATA